MKLVSFTIENFRSVNNSGPIDASRITTLVGRNESGKSNLLRALHSLNPAEGFKALNPIKDFPRHRRLEECTDETNVVTTIWALSNDEQDDLKKIWPRAAGVEKMEIGRVYGAADRWVRFVDVAAQDFEEDEIKGKVKKLVPAVKALADKQDDAAKQRLYSAADAFEQAVAILAHRAKWATNAVTGTQNLRKALATEDADLSEKQEQLLSDIENVAEPIANDRKAQVEARTWALEQMPEFIFLDEYPALQGHQDIRSYLARKAQNKPNDSDRSFDKLCKVAGLDPEELQQLLDQKEQETRNQLANRAGSVVTTEIKRLWKDRPLKVRFNLDGDHLETLISDPNATYEVEVNLDERSRGFQWFFAFYITFAADTDGGDAEDSILLLDEPGLYLHAKSQSDLLEHFEKGFTNQIIYTTHSPFMVPTHALDSVRTVNISEGAGTTVSNDPKGDSRTLFPLQAALGYSLSQSLFVGPKNLVVEGVTDYWMLSTISSYLHDNNGTGLCEDLTMTPAGGAQKVPYMVALLSSEELRVLVLLDKEKDSVATKDGLVKGKLIAERSVILVTDGFDDNPPSEADTEDLLDPEIYERLVRESYAKELKGKTLTLNAKIPRIVKRVEAALQSLGLEFHKTRPARLFLKKMASEPAAILPKESKDRFERLFTKINERLRDQESHRTAPFEN